MVVGSLLTKHNRKRRKDGSSYVSEAYYTLQYRDAQGRRRWRRVPRALKARVQKLVQEGDHYRELEREYAALATEFGLLQASKKND
jgi:hypothetical protein